MAPSPAAPPQSTPPMSSAIRFVRRLYIALPTIPVTLEDDPPAPPPSVPPPSPSPWLRIDVGGGNTVVAHGIVRDPRIPASFFFGADFGARVWVGPSLALVGGVDVSGGRYRRLGELVGVSVLEASAELGGGYRLRLDAFELGPFATLGVARRVVGDNAVGDRAPIITPTLGAGLTATWHFYGPFGVFLEAAGRWGLDGPVLYSTPNGADFYLGPAARARLGLMCEF